MTIPSLVLLVGLYGGTLVQAPLVQAPPVQAPPVLDPPKQAVKPAAPSIEEVIANALRSHPEILVAEAKLAGARADLELTKLMLSQKIVRAKSRLDAAQQSVKATSQVVEFLTNLVNTGRNPLDMVEPHAKALLAKEQFAEAEAVWKMYEASASAKKVAGSSFDDVSDEMLIEERKLTLGLRLKQVTPLAAPTDVDRERYKVLMTPLKLQKVAKLDLVQATKMLLAQPALKGLTLRVPVDVGTGSLRSPPTIEWFDEELTVVSWLQRFADQFNPQATEKAGRLAPQQFGQYDWYVREYGLVFENVANKPIGAPTLAEFLKTMRNSPMPMK